MNDLPRQKLREIIVQYGPSVCDDPRRCEGLLRDLCGGESREVFVLVNALRQGVATDLLAADASVPIEVLLGKLAKRLQDNLGLVEESSRWAVESWASALGRSIAGPKVIRPVASRGKSTTPAASRDAYTKSETSEGERAILVAGVSYFPGWTGITGRMTITNRRVLFEPDRFPLANLEQRSAEIPIDHVAEVGRINMLGVLPTGIRILTQEGIEYRFASQERDNVIRAIQHQMASR